MPHVPHLLVPGPWDSSSIPLGSEHQRHLETVLRLDLGSAVSYTDGAGTVGSGVWQAGAVQRGVEVAQPPPVRVTIAVAPPHSKDRQRWLVEKCTELGAWQIRWIRTRFGQGRPPRPDKSFAWMAGALEQSRRSWVTTIDESWCDLADLGDFVAADARGAELDAGADVVVAVGPEGGWAEDELGADVLRVRLSDHVLRTETAAIIAVSRALR